MPATAGRVRMPANNRVHSSAALQTHGIWQSAIGYDPYAPNKEKDDSKSAPQAASSSGPDAENAYASFQGLLALARVTNSNADEARGSCKKCGRVGHLTFQCRNFLSIKDDKHKDPEAIEAAVQSELEKLRGKMKGRDGGESSEESSEEESESSDSDYDSELERAIAKKFGKKVVSKLKSSKKDDSDDDVLDRKDRKKRGRSRKRRSGKKVESESDSEEDDRKKRRRRKEKKRRMKMRDVIVGGKVKERSGGGRTIVILKTQMPLWNLIGGLRGGARGKLPILMLVAQKIIMLAGIERSTLIKRAGNTDIKESAKCVLV